jgi:hypothetical protein
MGKRKKQIDRRKNRRFRVQAPSFVLFRPDSGKMGRIVDINMEGLTFRYIPEEEPLKDVFELDILMADESFYVKRIPIKTISDVESDKDAPLSSVVMRRRGVRFGTLSESQRLQLRAFIERHTHPA